MNVARRHHLQGGERTAVLFLLLDRWAAARVTHTHDLVEAGYSEAGKGVSMVITYLRDRGWIVTEASVWRKLRSLRIVPTAKATALIGEIRAEREQLAAAAEKEVAA